jgi:hypothetical protein
LFFLRGCADDSHAHLLSYQATNDPESATKAVIAAKTCVIAPAVGERAIVASRANVKKSTMTLTRFLVTVEGGFVNLEASVSTVAIAPINAAMYS